MDHLLTGERVNTIAQSWRMPPCPRLMSSHSEAAHSASAGAWRSCLTIRHKVAATRRGLYCPWGRRAGFPARGLCPSSGASMRCGALCLISREQGPAQERRLAAQWPGQVAVCLPEAASLSCPQRRYHLPVRARTRRPHQSGQAASWHVAAG